MCLTAKVQLSSSGFDSFQQQMFMYGYSDAFCFLSEDGKNDAHSQCCFLIVRGCVGVYGPL